MAISEMYEINSGALEALIQINATNFSRQARLIWRY